MEIKNLLPIGSVVLLKDAEKELMVIGICAANEDDRYDYIGVLYPEGFIDESMIFLFNHSDIQDIKYIGYMDSSYQLFRGALSAHLDGDGSEATEETETTEE